MSRCWKTASFLLLWGGCAFGTLQIGSAPGHWPHLCGPWGCAPPTQALVAWHGFWLVLLLGGVGLARGGLSPAWVFRLGVVMTAGGTVGLLGIACWQLAHPIQHLGAADLLPRYLYLLATLIDLPLLELVFAGLAGIALGHRPSGAAAAACRL